MDFLDFDECKVRECHLLHPREKRSDALLAVDITVVNNISLLTYLISLSTELFVVSKAPTRPSLPYLLSLNHRGHYYIGLNLGTFLNLGK